MTNVSSTAKLSWDKNSNRMNFMFGSVMSAHHSNLTFGEYGGVWTHYSNFTMIKMKTYHQNLTDYKSFREGVFTGCSVVR